MLTWNEIKKSLIAAVWFMFLTFPLMVIKVNTIYKTVGNPYMVPEETTQFEMGLDWNFVGDYVAAMTAFSIVSISTS